MQVDATSGPTALPAQSLSASFELTGEPQAGELRLFTPLGSTAALLRWTPQDATLEAGGRTQVFTGLDALTQQVLGASVPAPELFAWLHGKNLSAPGWQVDLSQFDQGRISAQRVDPLPAARLRLVLEP